MILAVPLAPSNGDMNFTAVLVPHTNPDPVKVTMMRAGKAMLC
jgi:hypothetical protein